MGTINPRLAKIYGAVRSGEALPVIVTTSVPPSQAIIDATKRLGAGQLRFISDLGNAFGTTATQAVAQRIARVPGVVEVWYDEPVIAFRTAR